MRAFQALCISAACLCATGLFGVAGCSDGAKNGTPAITPDAQSDAGGGADTGAPDDAGGSVMNDAGLPPLCGASAAGMFELCEDFQTGDWKPSWAPQREGAGSLAVMRVESAVGALSLGATATGSATQMLSHPFDPSKPAGLAWKVRVESLSQGEVTLLTIDARKGSRESVVLGAFQGTNRVAVYLDHTPNGGERQRLEVANFPLSRWTEMQLTVPRLGANGQPMHLVVNGDIRAFSYQETEGAATPVFRVGITSSASPASLFVDDMTLVNR